MVTGADGGSIEVSRVTLGSPADRAGLIVGDRIVSLGDIPFHDSTQFQLAVLEAESPVKMVVQRQDRSEPLEVHVELSGTPVRVGISWRENDAEPEAVTIVRVISGSAADRAQIKLMDRVLAVNGRPFRNGQEFQSILTKADRPFEFRIERQGIVSEVRIQ
jgi:C-terminal processing protease CtpA/Prc